MSLRPWSRVDEKFWFALTEASASRGTVRGFQGKYAQELAKGVLALPFPDFSHFFPFALFPSSLFPACRPSICISRPVAALVYEGTERERLARRRRAPPGPYPDVTR